MNLNSAGGQNIVQPGGINYLGMLRGARGSNRSVKQKFALQKLVMDYGQQQRIERDELAHKHRDTENKNKEVYKVAAPLAGAGINFEQNSEHYGLAAARASGHKEGTPEFEAAKLAGAKAHWQHAQLAGLDKGSLGNGIIGANLQKEMYDSTKVTKGADKETGTENVTDVEDDNTPPTRTPNQFEEVTPAASGAKAFSAPAAVDGSTPHPDEVSEAFAGGHITMGEAADLSPAHARIFNPILKDSPDSDAEIDRAHNGPSKPVFGSPLPSLGEAFKPAPTRTPSPFDAPEHKASRYDVAQAHIAGLITDEEANDHMGDNSFGSGTGNYSMSAEQVHRKAGLNTFGDSTRIGEFSAGQEKE
jgi:hypothetical protein